MKKLGVYCICNGMGEIMIELFGVSIRIYIIIICKFVCIFLIKFEYEVENSLFIFFYNERI